jgi:outer membrane biosynthesis protein TonB
VTGNVNVRVEVNEHGQPTNAAVVSGPGPVCPGVSTPAVTALREAAVATALRATYLPAMSGSTPVESATIVTVEFKLEGSPTKNTETAGLVADENSAPQTAMRTDTAPDRAAPAVGHLPKTINGGVLNGKATSLPVPTYPAAAKAVRASGAVSIQVVITEQGTVYSAQAVSGHPLLRAASEHAACNSTFSPTLLMSVPVKVSGIITYNFNL